jgi:hypothetical protein
VVGEVIGVLNAFEAETRELRARIEYCMKTGRGSPMPCALRLDALGAAWARISLLIKDSDPAVAEEVAREHAAMCYHLALGLKLMWEHGEHVMNAEVVSQMADSQYGLFRSLQPFSQGRAALRYGFFAFEFDGIHEHKNNPENPNKPQADGACLLPIVRSLVQGPDFDYERDCWFVLYLCEMCTRYIRDAFFSPVASESDLEGYEFVVRLAWDAVVSIGNELRARLSEQEERKTQFELWFGSSENPEMAYFHALERNVGEEVERVAERRAGSSGVEEEGVNCVLKEY